MLEICRFRHVSLFDLETFIVGVATLKHTDNKNTWKGRLGQAQSRNEMLASSGRQQSKGGGTRGDQEPLRRLGTPASSKRHTLSARARHWKGTCK